LKNSKVPRFFSNSSQENPIRMAKLLEEAKNDIIEISSESEGTLSNEWLGQKVNIP
jgi:hypothetical protein